MGPALAATSTREKASPRRSCLAIPQAPPDHGAVFKTALSTTSWMRSVTDSQYPLPRLDSEFAREKNSRLGWSGSLPFGEGVQHTHPQPRTDHYARDPCGPRL